jgi:hypothetical protein
MKKQSALYGLLALLGAIIAILISAPISIAYFRAYGNSVGEPTPVWLAVLESAYPTLLDFAERTRVYQTYGRIFFLTILFTIPGLFCLKRQIGTLTRLSRWGWRIFFGGVLLMALGSFGDYCCDQSGFWVSTGFGLEMIGTVVLWIGAVLYGVAALREDNGPRWIGGLLIGIAPVGILGLGILDHIPSGPLLGYFIFWLVVGPFLMMNKAG